QNSPPRRILRRPPTDICSDLKSQTPVSRMAPGVGLFGRQRSVQAVKKLVVKATVFVRFSGLVASAAVRGDGNASPAVEASPHKIGLIDMARVFKSYKKFEAMRDELKGELTKSEEKFKAMTEQIKKE